MNNRRRVLMMLAFGVLFLMLGIYVAYSQLEASTVPPKDIEIVVPATGVDQQLAREIALKIGRSYASDAQATVESLGQSQLANTDQAQNLVGLPSDQVWQVVLNGNFAIHEGPRLITAIRANKIYVLIRARDGQVLAVGTVGPTTIEGDKSLLAPK
jgi:hypothetical protein